MKGDDKRALFTYNLHKCKLVMQRAEDRDFDVCDTCDMIKSCTLMSDYFGYTDEKRRSESE